MKVQLGVFQEQEQIELSLEAKGIIPRNIMVAGPFPTRLQAFEWMDFIEKRTGQGKLMRHAVGLMNRHPWYGLIFELKTTAMVRKTMPGDLGLCAQSISAKIPVPRTLDVSGEGRRFILA